jgi:hypothetical protein
MLEKDNRTLGDVAEADKISFSLPVSEMHNLRGFIKWRHFSLPSRLGAVGQPWEVGEEGECTESRVSMLLPH